MIALVRNESGAEIIEEALADDSILCYVHAINVCEAFYILSRLTSEERVQRAFSNFAALGLVVRADMDTAFWQQAGRYKATIRRVSLADCFAIALTNRIGGERLTSDHLELDPIAASGVCRVRFFR